ncbi:MAG: FAD-dependent oxidoreductase [Acidobacteriota bacterium]
MTTDVLIIGGGLSGLHTAYSLHRKGIDAVLVEARSRLGGRILSRPVKASGNAGFDLGPTWFWPGQHRIEALVRDLGLWDRVFEQPSAGDALYENVGGAVARGIDGASMAGSFRLEGGLARIIAALARHVPKEMVRCGSRATRISLQGQSLRTTMACGEREETIDSAQVVVALPPRLAARSIALSPELASSQSAAMVGTPTWMAGQAKLMALYDEPFWRADGLSGDAISYRGPLAEIHDASPRTGGPAALFGFVGVPAEARGASVDALREAALAQLANLFGRHAAQPLDVWIKDWAFDPLTATTDDRAAQHAHPPPWSGQPSEATWDHRLIWSGSETAAGGLRNNGYLEGALEASERTLRQLESAG